MKSIVCIAAHPDDLEFTCTGTLSRFINEGYEIIYVIVTNGENGFKSEPKLTAKERIEIRKKEQLEVAKLLGVKEVIFLGYIDGFLEYTEELRRRLVMIIKKYKPEIVFSFDPANRTFNSLNLLHRDHRTVSEAAFDACFAAKNQLMYPCELHRIEKMYFFASDNPNYFEDITNKIDFKLKLLSCHKSQFPDFTKIIDYIKNTVSKHTEEFEYSESFRIMEVRQVT